MVKSDFDFFPTFSLCSQVETNAINIPFYRLELLRFLGGKF